MLSTFVNHLVVYSIRRGLEVGQEMRCSQGFQEFLFQKQMTTKLRSEKLSTSFIFPSKSRAIYYSLYYDT